MEFTPGPWKVKKTYYDCGICGEKGHKKISVWADSVCIYENYFVREFDEANANLIANAPKMYETLKKIKKIVDSTLNEIEQSLK